MTLEQHSQEANNKEAAMALMDSYPLLKNDALTQQVLDSGIGLNGQPIKDFEKFIKGRGAFLELEEIKESYPDVYNAIVVHSVRPDQEQAWEN